MTVAINIMRRFTFCAGHRLLGHEGKCQNLHGHNYVAEVYVTGQEQDAIGRILDFKALKQRCQTWLDDHWDHAFLLWDQDQNAIEAVRHCDPHRIYEMPYNPTAENLAKYLLEQVCPKILEGTGANAYKVCVWESEETHAEATLMSDGSPPASSGSHR
jgi:6-pyruvoyltetrahydropterin/6-carboxytetrahydropterin synthase